MPTLQVPKPPAPLTLAGEEGAHVLLELLQSCRSPLLMSMKPDSRQQRAVARVAEDTIVLAVAKAEAREVLGGVASTIPGRARYREETLQIARGAVALVEEASPRLIPDSGAWSLPALRNPGLEHPLRSCYHRRNWRDAGMRLRIGATSFSMA